jgi:nucleoside-diphosphate-sugar epimerase
VHVFLAGATGVLGRRIVPLLLADGHRVSALARSEDAATRLRSWGALPVVADATDVDAVVAAVVAAHPDVVMNQLTDLAGGIGPANSDLRVVTSRILADAARAAGVRRVVAQSIAWAYVAGEGPAAEADALDVDAPDPRGRSTRAVAALEAATAEAPEWVALRYGMLYGPDTWYRPEGARAEETRRGELLPGPDVTSFVHVDDAARAAVAALAWPAGPVNVVDDEPAVADVWVPAFARVVGAHGVESAVPPRRTPWARGADNSLLRSRGFVLEHPTWSPRFGL